MPAGTDTRASGRPLEYREIAAPPELAAHVQCLWELRADGPLAAPQRTRALPDGCADLVLRLRGASRPRGGSAAPGVIEEPGTAGPGTAEAGTAGPGTAGPGTAGPGTAAPGSAAPGSAAPASSDPGAFARCLVGARRSALELELAGPVHVVGICVRPGGLPPLLGIDADEAADRLLALDDVLDGARRSHLQSRVDRLLEVPPARALARLGELLVDWARPHPTREDPAIAAAIAAIRGGGGRTSIAALAREVGLSLRQLERRFTARVGLSPKLFGRIVRFDAAVRRLGRAGPGLRLSELAIEGGYCDQPHFNREFVEFAGVSPREFLRGR